MKVRLSEIAHARSGDKGDASNVGILADSDRGFEVLKEQVTAERVKEHLKDVCRGAVERFEVPNLRAFNFLLHDSLGGGGTESLKIDAQGKTHAQGLLQMEVEVADDFFDRPGRDVAGEATEAEGGPGGGAGFSTAVGT